MIEHSGKASPVKVIIPFHIVPWIMKITENRENSAASSSSSSLDVFLCV